MSHDLLVHLAPVFAAYLVAIASPGPSTLAIMGVAMNQGRANAAALALGVVTGSLIWAGLAASGLSTLLAAWAEAMLAIKIAGGLYLLWLAWKSARSACRREAAARAAIPAAGRGALYRRGVALHLANPKAVLGWIAIISLGLGPEAPPGALPAMLVGCAALGLIVNLGYALLFSTAPMVGAYRRARRGIEGVLAACFGYAGIRLLLLRP